MDLTKKEKKKNLGAKTRFRFLLKKKNSTAKTAL
jgi:hypothetical protein